MRHCLLLRRGGCLCLRAAERSFPDGLRLDVCLREAERSSSYGLRLAVYFYGQLSVLLHMD